MCQNVVSCKIRKNTCDTFTFLFWFASLLGINTETRKDKFGGFKGKLLFEQWNQFMEMFFIVYFCTLLNNNNNDNNN